MYTLRKITKEEMEFNQYLGVNYSVIKRKTNEDNFIRVYKDLFNSNLKPDEIETTGCYAFVISENQKDIYPLFIEDKNYIVNSDGKTFSNLTH